MKPHCKICGVKMQSRGTRKDMVLGIRRETSSFYCPLCKAWHYEPSRHERPAKILLLDIEIIPGEYYSWSAKPPKFFSPENRIKDWSISCWAAKWLFEPKIMGEVVSPKEAIERKEGSILKRIWKLMNEADIIVSHNGNWFDIPKLKAKWIKYGYPRPSFYRSVDTYQVANQFGFTYKRLDELGAVFGIGGKRDMRFPDFTDCAKGNKNALEKMLIYCKRDVTLLEDVYLYLLPWMDNHPNLNIFSEQTNGLCRNCGSTNLNWETETYGTPQGLWKGWRCQTCGAIGRGTTKDYNIRKTNVK